MNPNILPTQRTAVVGAIDPDALSTGTYTTGWVSMADWNAVLATVMAGALGTSATLDAKIEGATDGSGTDAQDLDGKAISQLTQAGDDDSDSQALINVRADDLSDGYTHVRLSLTVGTATSDAGALLQGFDPRHHPVATGDDATSVVEIVD